MMRIFSACTSDINQIPRLPQTHLRLTTTRKIKQRSCKRLKAWMLPCYFNWKNNCSLNTCLICRVSINILIVLKWFKSMSVHCVDSNPPILLTEMLDYLTRLDRSAINDVLIWLFKEVLAKLRKPKCKIFKMRKLNVKTRRNTDKRIKIIWIFRMKINGRSM